MALAPGAENPSAAFLAGQQHGVRLATQHAVPAKPATTKPTASPTRRPAAASGSTPVNDLLAQAKALAAADTQAQVNAIRQQQNMLTTQGQQRATQISQASQAAAEFLSGLGDKTAASYTQAGKDLAGIAQGYSGQTRTDATSAADQVAANLALLGAPAGAAKTATGQTIQPEALSNVLYGLGGAMPASTLLNAGQLQAAVQRGLPASMLGYGQQQAAGTIAAGNKAAQDLLPQLLSAQAGLPAATRQYLSTLAGLKHDAFTEKLALAKYGTGIDQFNTRTKIQMARLDLSAKQFAQTALNQDRSYQVALANLGISQAKEQRAALAQEYKFQNNGFTKVQVNKFETDAQFVASQVATAKTKPTVAQAMQEMYKRHVPLSKAIDALKPVYGDVFGQLQLGLVGVGQQADPFDRRLQGRVTVAPGANRAGVSLNPLVQAFVGRVSYLAGTPLTIGTGSNHNEYVKGSSRVSDHWSGNAADIPATGATLTRLGQDALIAAGMPEAQARRQTGGLYNLQTPYGRVQVIFNSMEGGNHYTHLHVGVRP